MKLTSSILVALAIGSSLTARLSDMRDLNKDLPIIASAASERYEKVPNVAQYGGADWKNALGVAKNISLKEAWEIADSNPDITFFFYTKGGQMVLTPSDDSFRLFRRGDAVFFAGSPWWGSAPGLADGYIKK